MNLEKLFRPGGADWQTVDPALYYMRTTPLFETGDARYSRLNRIVCVATGARRAAAAELEVFKFYDSDRWPGFDK